MRLMTVGHAGQATGLDGPSRYGAGRKSPLGLGGTVAVHALLIGAFLVIPKEIIELADPYSPIQTVNIPIDPPPLPEPTSEKTPDRPVSTLPQPQQPTAPDTIIPLPTENGTITGRPESGHDPVVTPYVPPVEPPRQPVMTDASIDPRAMGGFQPDYPGTMIRQGAEGTVTVRVTISAEGRVTDIEKVSATDDAFWIATQRHALRKWRFRAATRDGVAITSTKVLTVHFTLTDH